MGPFNTTYMTTRSIDRKIVRLKKQQGKFMENPVMYNNLEKRIETLVKTKGK